MSKYLLAIDPVLLLSEKQMTKITKNSESMKNSGTVGDAVKDILSKEYEFADLFQSTDETHTVNVHDFLMKEKTNERGMHNIGDLKTPTGLVAYVTVDDEWMKNHPNEVEAGAYVELDPRVDVQQLHANDGATKDGQTTGFIRYGDYKTPVMAMLPAGPINIDETVEDMERMADEREMSLRNRQSKVATIHSAFRSANAGSSLDAFLAGWNLVDQMKGVSEPTPMIPIRNKMEEEVLPSNTPQTLTDSLKELSIREMMNNQQQ